MSDPSPSPTVAELAALHGAGFTFMCRPCNRSKTYTGPELVARVGTEETWQSLRARTVCPQCQMPVDGDFRTFDFHSTQYLHKLQQQGLNGGGWSGPK
jgi:hypothetical protein